MLATTEIHKIPATVLSRCQRHEFRRIPVQTIIEKLKLLCAQEHIEIEDEALSLVARQATGSLRDAISLIDQLSSIGKVITLETAIGEYPGYSYQPSSARLGSGDSAITIAHAD